MGLSFTNVLGLFKCTYYTYNTLLKILSSALYRHMPSVSPGFAKQIMSILLIFCYNGSLITWTVVSLIIAKFKPLIISVSGFALSYTANMFILIILYDFCTPLRPREIASGRTQQKTPCLQLLFYSMTWTSQGTHIKHRFHSSPAVAWRHWCRWEVYLRHPVSTGDVFHCCV
jgi:hypothetical protein